MDGAPLQGTASGECAYAYDGGIMVEGRNKKHFRTKSNPKKKRGEK